MLLLILAVLAGFGWRDDPVLEHVRTLASEEFRGRGNYTAELDRAAEYIAGHFSAWGLKPMGEAGDFFQEFAPRRLEVGTERVLRNVVGMLEGSRDEVVVIGAHYDHLGLGETGSLSAGRPGRIHFGADDNASGTAGLLYLAQQWSGETPRRGILFIAFAGEELGLLGSRHYVAYPVVPLEQTAAMLNLDMIGRSRGSVILTGVETSGAFRPLLRKLPNPRRLNVRFGFSTRVSSDHLPFFEAGIPVLFFFTGMHDDYHRPGDVWQKIDVIGIYEVSELVTQILLGLEELKEIPRPTLP